MLLEKLIEEKNHADSTARSFRACIKLYEEVCGKSLDDLIKEADAEEEAGIRWKRRQLREHLIEFRKYLYTNRSEGTAKRYMTIVKTVYNHYEIEVHKLPSFASKQIDKTYKMKYSDLLTKEELIDGYYEANNLVKCIITFGISSGLSKVDMLDLTVGDFLDACSEYTTQNGILEQLLELKGKDIIPCFEGNRKKTDSSYITFCSPEAAEHIIQYLIGEDIRLREEGMTLERDQKLFGITTSYVSKVFQKINKKLNLGKAGKFGRFRCHMLRKFHASTLLNTEILTWTVEEIDTLQGRSMDKTHQAYFKNSKEKLFKKYYACVDELMLFKSIHEIGKDAYDKLAEENKFYKNEMEEQKKTIEKIKDAQKELEEMLLKVKV